MASLTINALQIQIQSLLNDNVNYEVSSPDEHPSGTWDDDSYLAAINFAQKEYCKFTACSYITATCHANADLQTITLPTDLLEIKRVALGKVISTLHGESFGPGILMRSSKMMEFAVNPHFEYESGIPKKWFVLDGRTIQLAKSLASDYSTSVFSIGYSQVPVQATTHRQIKDYEMRVGMWYEIVTPRAGLNYTLYGAGASSVGTQFKCTAVPASTADYSALREIVDPRIIEANQPYLKYKAASFLLAMTRDQKSLESALKYDEMFQSLCMGGGLR